MVDFKGRLDKAAALITECGERYKREPDNAQLEDFLLGAFMVFGAVMGESYDEYIAHNGN